MSDQFSFMQQNEQIDQAWFSDIADRLLNHTTFRVNGADHRLLEIEFYYNGEPHEDPFAHCDPMQQTFGKWYFHRDSGSYRGGSFKGLDITFGPEGVFGGILIRTIQKPDGEIVNGCSLCVDHMLRVTEQESVAALDAHLEDKQVWEDGGPLQLIPSDDLEQREVTATARVGLTLKRMYQHRTMPEYIMRRYRFLTRPNISKGRLHTIISLHQEGKNVDEIKELTGSRKNSITKYVNFYTEGLEQENFNVWRGKKLSSEDLCRMHGVWHKTYGED